MLPSFVNYYQILGVATNASDLEIRQAYRELSKQYHPDTTKFPLAVAQQRFLDIRAAYDVLSNPEERSRHDQQRRYLQNLQRYLERSQRSLSSSARSQATASQTPTSASQSSSSRSDSAPPHYPRSNSAYLDPQERPLSAGEVFALFILGLTLLGCILLALALGMARGQVLIDPPF